MQSLYEKYVMYKYALIHFSNILENPYSNMLNESIFPPNCLFHIDIFFLSLPILFNIIYFYRSSSYNTQAESSVPRYKEEKTYKLLRINSTTNVYKIYKKKK